MTVYQWNDFIQASMSRDTQIFIVGFFGAILTIWPLCMLFLLPHDVFVAKHVIIQEAVKKAAMLTKENDKLRAELIDREAIIDALLKEKFNEQS